VMHEPEKSDSVVVAEKPTKGGDQGERGPAKHGPSAGPGKCVTGAGTLTQAARQGKKERFTSLLHHVDRAMLRTKRGGPPRSRWSRERPLRRPVSDEKFGGLIARNQVRT